MTEVFNNFPLSPSIQIPAQYLPHATTTWFRIPFNSPRQISHSWVRIPRASWSYFTVSDSSLPQPRGPGPRIYIPQEHGGLVIPPGCPYTDTKEKRSSIVQNACLLVRYLAMDVLFFRAFTSAEICLPTRCLAMGIHVIVCSPASMHFQNMKIATKSLANSTIERWTDDKSFTWCINVNNPNILPK
jgi:hypothetical protein